MSKEISVSWKTMENIQVATCFVTALVDLPVKGDKVVLDQLYTVVTRCVQYRDDANGRPSLRHVDIGLQKFVGR